MRRFKCRFLKPALTKAIEFTILCLFVGNVSAKELCPKGSDQLIIYHAGSLSAAFSLLEDLYTQQSGVCVVDVAGGSVGLARQLSTGRVSADLIASADYEVIDQLLKTTKVVDYNIRFAEGSMVLAYTTSSKNASSIAESKRAFNPPDSIPEVASDWYQQLIKPGIKISGSHPFLDPGGYRADMIFQLAQDFYNQSGLYNELLTHYIISNEHNGLGRLYDYQLTYEHSAKSIYLADKTGTYRYAKLPDELNLGTNALNYLYTKYSVTLPGLQSKNPSSTITIPATHVVWGIATLNNSLHQENAIIFLKLLLSRQGLAIMNQVGPSPISPPIVSKQDYGNLPAVLKEIVQIQNDHK